MRGLLIVYEPKGKAREYCPLAANLYSGCTHRCEYCYVPKIFHTTVEERARNVAPVKDAMPRLLHDARELEDGGNEEPIFLSFTCDPYQHLDEEICLTGKTLEVLFAHGQRVVLCTKGGRRSAADFHLLEEHKELVEYGATLVFPNDDDASIWEPGAASTSERIAALRRAHDLGLRTWVSLEPVYRPSDALALIDATHEFVDVYKVGKLNHFPELERLVDWGRFASEVETKLRALGKEYYLKKDLIRAAGLRADISPDIRKKNSR